MSAHSKLSVFFSLLRGLCAQKYGVLRVSIYWERVQGPFVSMCVYISIFFHKLYRANKEIEETTKRMPVNHPRKAIIALSLLEISRSLPRPLLVTSCAILSHQAHRTLPPFHWSILLSRSSPVHQPLCQTPSFLSRPFFLAPSLQRSADL